MTIRLRIFGAALAAGAIGLCAYAFAERENAQAATATPACLRPASWALLDAEPPRAASAAAVLTAMAKRDVLLLGELHDSEDDHRWQLQTLAALHVLRPDMVIGFEMFPRRAQAVLDDWVAGRLTVRQLLDQSQWNVVWKLPADLYLPLFQFARNNRIPMVALNVDQKLIRATAQNGWDAVPPADREGVGRAAPVAPAYRDFLFEVYGEHPNGHGKDRTKAQPTDGAFGRFVESQAVWDRAMAEALASRVTAGPQGVQPLVVGIMGSGHLRDGHGVPHQLRDLGVKNVGSLLPVPAALDCKELRPGMADAVFALPETARPAPEPPRLGVRLEESGATVRIVDVTAGSLAERTGLKAGDQIVEVAGLPVSRTLQVIAAIRQQPPGTWLPLRVKRGDDSLDLVVRFAPKQ